MPSKSDLSNIKLICKTCGNEFDYTVTEQLFFIEKGFSAPIRCHDCRKAKKASNEKNNPIAPIVTEEDDSNDTRPQWVKDMEKDWHNRTVEIKHKQSI